MPADEPRKPVLRVVRPPRRRNPTGPVGTEVSLPVRPVTDKRLKRGVHLRLVHPGHRSLDRPELRAGSPRLRDATGQRAKAEGSDASTQTTEAAHPADGPVEPRCAARRGRLNDNGEERYAEVMRKGEGQKDEVAENGGAAIEKATDPRWVLAVRTSEQLQGPLLPPERREQLLRLGKILGLSVFDANLVIAIVQDQARRGHAGGACAAAGASQLRMVPRPPMRPWGPSLRGGRAWMVAFVIAGTIAGELLLLRMLF